MRTSSILRRTIVAAAAVTVAFSLSGCSLINEIFPQQATRDGDSNEVVEAGQADVFTVKVGDCVGDTGSGDTVSDVTVIPCAEPHKYEVYHEFSLAEGDFPGDEAVATEADTQCAAQFDVFVGMAYADSSLDFTYFVPTDGSWSEGDRLVSCLIVDPAADTTGSLAGAAR